MKVPRRMSGAQKYSHNFGTALIAVILTIGLNGARVSAADAYGNAKTSIDGLGLATTQTIILHPNQVINYKLIEYAEFVPGIVNCAVESCIALTFDDGPDSVTTSQILNILSSYHAHATFFVLGNKIGANIDLLQRMHANRHEVGNHSWGHPDFTKLSVIQIKEQIDETQKAVVTAGLPAPRYFRPPYESRNHQVIQVVNMPFILWNVDPEDWRSKSADKIVDRTVGTIKPGSIVVLHDTKALTVQALPIILEKLKGQYHFVTVSELLNSPASAQVEYFGRYH